MDSLYIGLALAVWGVFVFTLYRKQQGKAQQLLNNPDFIKQVADQIRSGKSEEEVAGFLRRTYKLPVLTGQLIYRQVKAKL